MLMWPFVEENIIVKDVLPESEEKKSMSIDESLGLKALCRKGVPLNHPIRKSLWLKALRIELQDNDDEQYEKTVNEIFSSDIELSLPTFIDKRFLPTYHLNEKGKLAAARILRVLEYNKPFITYAPLLYPLSSICLHYFNESICYKILWRLTENNYEYVTTTELQWYAYCTTLVDTISKYSSKAHEFLKSTHILKTDQLFTNWMDWLFEYFSFKSIVPIIDCYFVEGIKIFIRCVISIAKIASYSFPKKKISSKNAAISYNNMKEIFVEIEMNSKVVLKSGCCLKNLSKKNISEYINKNEKTIADVKRANILIMKNEQARKMSQLGLIKPPKGGLASFQRLLSYQSTLEESNVGCYATVPYVALKVDLKTDTLTNTDLMKLRSNIPQRILLYTPTVIYTTLTHGKRLLTLYDHVEFYENIILAVKTTDNDVVGAFISTQLAERTKYVERYFGNGETFLFSKKNNRPLEVYRWIGITKGKPLEHSEELFIRCNNLGIFIGGGGGDGLFLSSDLLTGASSYCQTFCNDKLTTKTLFEIKIVEVIGFHS